MGEATPRLGLPLLQAGQAQKDITHNEAVILVDHMIFPTVQEGPLNEPPPSPMDGSSWLVGSSPIGAWAGQAEAIACATEGGWRFVRAREGMLVWRIDSNVFSLHRNGSWTSGAWPASAIEIDGEIILSGRQAAITAPSGGTTVDIEARVAIASILDRMRGHGLIET